LVHHVVEALLAHFDGSRSRDGLQSLGGEHAGASGVALTLEATITPNAPGR
jgi:hypothetical protein